MVARGRDGMDVLAQPARRGREAVARVLRRDRAHAATLRVDLQRTHPDVHVTLVMPGLVATEFASHARGSIGASPAGPIGSPMMPQTPEEVATIVADLLDHPVAEVYTNPASRALATRYFDDVGRFEMENRRPS